MNGYNFTERVRKVLAMAREEAARLHHEYVGTEHILLGLIREGEGVAAAVLAVVVGEDQVRVLEPRAGAGLLAEPLGGGLVARGVQGDDLQRDLAAEALLDGAVDDAVGIARGHAAQFEMP